MTNFAYLSEDKLVQSASYGKNMNIIVNFSNEDIEIGKTKIKQNQLSLLTMESKLCIYQTNKIIIYRFYYVFYVNSDLPKISTRV